MSHGIRTFVFGGALLCAMDAGMAQEAMTHQLVESTIISPECTNPGSDKLGWAGMERYWGDVTRRNENSKNRGAPARRNWAQRWILDRTTLEAGYGTNYTLNSGGTDRILTTTDGRSAALKYSIPLGAIFTSEDQRAAPGDQAEFERVRDLRQAKAAFFAQFFDMKIALAKVPKDGAAALYVAERIATEIASASETFDDECLAPEFKIPDPPERPVREHVERRIRPGRD